MKSIILILYLVISLNSRKAERIVKRNLIEPILKRNIPDMDDLELLEKSDYITEIRLYYRYNFYCI